jgi:tetratricopeptide (TPR) repeat protein
MSPGATPAGVIMMMSDVKRNLARVLMPVGTAVLVLCLVLLTGCGENTELKVDQARIALANNKPDRALSLVDSVLAHDPGNYDALLIQAEAQVALGRLGPAKLTLDRLARQNTDDPQAARALLDWSISTIDAVLENPAFAITLTDRKSYDEAMSVADTQLSILRSRAGAETEVLYNEALLSKGDLNWSRILIKHTERAIDELGAEARVESPKADGSPQEDGEEAGPTYAQQLETLKQAEMEALDRLLFNLEGVLQAEPGHADAAALFLRIAAVEQRWDRLLSQAQRFSEGTDLPVPIAERTISMLLGLPDATATKAERIELGQKILRATPTDQSGAEGRLISSARLMLADEQVDKALPILAKLIEDGTEDADAFVLYSHALYESGDYAKCREIVERMLPVMSSVSGVQTLYGLTLWRLGEMTDARTALREACRLAPDNKLAVDAFTSLMVQQGMLGASGEDVEAFYALDPTNPRAIQFKLQHAAASGDPQQAAALVEELEQRPEHSEGELGLLYTANIMLGRYNAAERWARAVVELQPENMDAWMRLAAAQQRQEDEAGLQETMAHINQRFPDAPSAAQLTGELYLQTQQYERAVAVLGMAVEEDPGNTRAKLTLAGALAAMGRFNSALDEVREVLEVDPDDSRALALGARIAHAHGQSELAAEYLGRIDPAGVDAERDPALAAQVRLSRGELDEAEVVCTQAIASGNTSPLLRLVLAEVYQKKGESERAEEHLVALVRHYPNSAEAYAWLGQFYASSGRTEIGIQKLKEVEVYNETLAIMTQASMLRAAERLDDAVLLLDLLLDRLVSQRDPMAQTVADMIAQLHQQRGDAPAAEAVYDRLYNQQTGGGAGLLSGVLETWDTDTPERRMAELDAVAARVQADDTATLIELSRRYAMLGRAEQSLAVVQRGLAQTSDNVALLGVKAGVLVMLGQTGEAVDAYRRVLKLSPKDRELRVRYARALSADGRRPEAEGELMRLVSEGDEAALSARAALLEVYLELGLYERAASTVDAVLDKLPIGENAALDLVIGRVLMHQGRHAEAQHRLASVIDDSPYYIAARVAHARSLAMSGDMPSAQSEVTGLVADPGWSSRTLLILLGMNPRDEIDRTLLISADSGIDVQTLSYDLALRWLAMRLRLADMQGDWARAGETLDLVTRLNDDDSVVSLRVVLMYQSGDMDAALKLLRQSPRLEGTATGSLLAIALGTNPPKAGRMHPMVGIIAALDEGDRGGLESVAKGYYGIRTLFVDDLLASCPDGVKADASLHVLYSDLAMATVAMEGRMNGLAAALCESALLRVPRNQQALALLAAAQIEQGHDVVELTRQARELMPEGSLPLMLDVVALVAAGEHTAALKPLRELTSRHPDNPYLAYQQAQELGAAGLVDEAARAYTPITAGTGPYHLAAKNDLAFLRAQAGGEGLNEAIGLAREVFRALPTSPAVMDTAGWIEHLSGRSEAALDLLTRGIGSLSDVPEAHYHLGAVYHALGEERWARYHLQQAAAGPEGERGVDEARALLSKVTDVVGWQ